MKRKLLERLFSKNRLIAIPAAALMLGQAQAANTVGINFYGSYGGSYAGAAVSDTAFGVPVADWTTAPSDAASGFLAVSPSGGGGLTVSWNSANTWISWITELSEAPGYPGDRNVYYGYLDDGGTGYSVDLTGLNGCFPSGYVVQTLASTDGGSGFANALVIEGVNTQELVYATSRTGWGGAYGISTGSTNLTSDTLTLQGGPKSGNRSTLAGFIITDKPVVSQTPLSITNNLGTSFTLKSGAVGLAPLSYQWRHYGTNIPGATTATYTVASATATDAGDYDVVVTNSKGSASSAVATVTLLLAPTILTDVTPGATNYLTMNQGFGVVVGGQQPLSFQWYKDGTPIAGATGDTLSLQNLQASAQGNYLVIITNALGAATSSVASLTIVNAQPPSESFDYADGSLIGNGTGASWAGAWTQSTGYNGENQVFSPGATYQDATNKLTTSGGAVQMAVSGASDFENIRNLQCALGGGGAGTVYLSFIGQVTNTGWGGLELALDSASQLLLGANWYANNWGWGDRGNFNSQCGHSAVPSSTLAFVVYRFDFTATNTQVRLYVNPGLGSEPAAASVAGTWDLFRFNQIRIVAHGAGLNNGVIDEVRLGGTWSAVMPFTARTDVPTIVTDLNPTMYAFTGVPRTLSVVANGAPPLSYNWKKGGTTIATTTDASYTLPALTLADTGDYSVSVSNPSGTANGATSHLTVVAPGLYQAQALLSTPASYWPFNEAMSATAFDYAGPNDGVAYVNPAQPGPAAPGQAGFAAGNTAYQFDGASTSVKFPAAAAISGTNDFAISAWIKTTGSGYIMQQRSGYNGEYMLTVGANGTMNFTVYGNNAYQFNFATTQTVNDDQWHHVVAVRSGTAGYIYVDGRMAATATGTVQPLDPSFTVAVGYDARDNGSFFGGSIDEVALYQHALTADEVRFQYYMGKYGSTNAPPTIATQPVPRTIAVGGTATFVVAAEGTAPLGYQWKKDGADLTGQTTAKLTLSKVQASNAGSYTVTVSNPYGTVNSAGAVLTVLPAPTGYAATVTGSDPVAYWPLNEATGPTAFDIWSGYDATGLGTAYFGLPGRGGSNCVSFDGQAGTRVAAPYAADLNPAGSFSVEAWLNPGALLTDTTLTCALSSGHFATPRSGWLIYQGTNGWNLRLYNENAGNTSLSISSGVQPTAGTWYHVVAVWDGTKGYLYQNGSMAASGTATGTPNFVANRDGAFTIGARADNTFPWAGLASDVAFYSRALSAAEVQSHYLNLPPLKFAVSGGSLILSWPSGTLQQADEPGGSYTDVQNATSPLTVSPTAAKKFYRLKF